MGRETVGRRRDGCEPRGKTRIRAALFIFLASCDGLKLTGLWGVQHMGSFYSHIVVISFVKLLVNPFCKHEQLLFLAKLALFFRRPKLS